MSFLYGWQINDSICVDKRGKMLTLLDLWTVIFLFKLNRNFFFIEIEGKTTPKKLFQEMSNK